MRECLICGTTRDNGNPGMIYDYCPECLRTDTETLRLIHLAKIRGQKKAPPNPDEDHREA